MQSYLYFLTVIKIVKKNGLRRCGTEELNTKKHGNEIENRKLEKGSEPHPNRAKKKAGKLAKTDWC